MKKKYAIWILLICFSLSLLLTSCDITETGNLYYHNKILFTSNRSGKKQLYMMNPDGSDIRQITSGQYWHNYGRWSQDAQKIVCNTEEETTSAGFEMVILNSDGTNRKLLGWGSQMSLSPDGNKIAFTYLPMAELGLMYSFIYIVNSDGTNRQEITKDSLEEISSPIWSIDGSKIYFTSNRYNVSNHNIGELYYMNNDGTDVTRLTYTTDGSSYSPSISPSGSKIVFMSIMYGALRGMIYMCDIEGNNITLIATPPENEIYNFPRWSPDEQSIVFISVLTDGTAKTSIHKVGIDGKNLTKLADDAGQPDWSK